MKEALVYSSTDLSIFAQFITGVIGISGYGKDIPAEHNILKSILGMELAVQGVELLVYVLVIRHMTLASMAKVRYYDWLVTTPVMLITSIIYYTYETLLQNNQKEKLKKMTLANFVKKNNMNMAVIILLNLLMLTFGYLGETGVINNMVATSGGFVFLIACFVFIYKKYAKYSDKGMTIFGIMFILWLGYGGAFLLNPSQKNVVFNGLDVLAKNFFGVYLAVKIINLRK